ncbi:MAG: hypothetical protein IT175_06425 [Acidobacteria bacterium]|nr:hypothetical protein [Acidobacteriota bacterium]
MRGRCCLVATVMLVLITSGGIASSGVRSGDGILADTNLFPPGFAEAWRDYSGSLPYPVPAWHRPRVADVVTRHGPPDAIVHHAVGVLDVNVLVYGSIALGVEEDTIGWVAAWKTEPSGGDAESILRACPAALDGHWTGSSGVGAVAFTIENRALVDVRIDFSITNGGCRANGYTTIGFSSPQPISGNTISVSIPPIPDLGFTLTGTLDAAGTATGTLNFIFNPCGYNRTSNWNASNRTFGLCVDPRSALVGRSDSVSLPVQVLSLGGFAGTVGLQAAVTPAEPSLVASLVSTSVAAGGSTTLDVATGAATPFGDYLVTITGTSAGVTHRSTATITVSPPDFALSVSPSTITVNPKQKGDLPVTIDRIAGFAGSVTVTAPDTKPFRIKLKPASLTTTGDSAVFAFKIKKTAVPGTYALTFSGVDSEGRTRTTTVTLVVQ